MSIATEFRRWNVTQTFGASATCIASGGVFNYRLTAADPITSTLPPSRHFFVRAPSVNLQYSRRHLVDSPHYEIVSEPSFIYGKQRPRLSTVFDLIFAGAGGGPGIEVACNISTERHFSTTSNLHFLSPSLSAHQMRGPGVIIDGGFNDSPYGHNVVGMQILLIATPSEIFGGIVSLGRRLERVISAARSEGAFSAILETIRPSTMWAIVATEATGLSVGLTLFGGVFTVRAR